MTAVKKAREVQFSFLCSASAKVNEKVFMRKFGDVSMDLRLRIWIEFFVR